MRAIQYILLASDIVTDQRGASLTTAKLNGVNFEKVKAFT
jgi:hypothetical protein